jgi:hypothetical protein
VATFGTCTNVNVTSGMCGITCGANTAKIGTQVTLSGFTYATFLNGVTTYVVDVNPTGFYVMSANANYVHTDTGTATASPTQKRYLCDGVTDAGQARGNVLQSLLSSMAGYCIPPGDMWRIIAGAYYTPTIILTEDDCRGPIKMDTMISLRDLANGITGTFVSPANNWQDSSFPPYQDAAALAADGSQPIWQDIQLQYTTDGVMTQRLAKIYLEKIRRQKSLVLPCKLSAFPLQPGDTVMFTFPLFGFNQKVFEVQQTSLVLDTAATQVLFGVGQPGSDNTMTSGNQAYSNQVPCVGVDLTLRETDANVFAWNPATDENTWLGPRLKPPSPNPKVCQPPTLVTATSGAGTAMVRVDGIITDRILIQWTSPADAFVTSGGYIEIYSTPHGAGTWSLQGSASGDDTQFYILNCVDGVSYDVIVFAINIAGVNSAGVQINSIVASGGVTNFGGNIGTIPASQIAATILIAPYAGGTAYTPGMEVTYNGNTYKCIASTTGNLPTNATYWQAMTGIYSFTGICNSGGSSAWYKVGTLVFGNVGETASLTFLSGQGYNTNVQQQTTTTISIRSANNFSAPNLSGISWFENGGSSSINSSVLNVKAVATGGSTSISNLSWDLYMEVSTYSTGTLSTNMGPDCSFTLINTVASDPGVASSTCVLGIGGYGLGGVNDGTQKFSATASTLSYRPLTNPLTGHDSGSNATVNVASFTMRTSSKGDIAITGGSVTVLSYSTLYYIYYSDSALNGGAVTFAATTTKELVLSQPGYLFVGSITTPAANTLDTSGNNDGGSGAQLGSKLTLSMSTLSAATIGGNGALVNPSYAIDGSGTTFAKLTLTGNSAANAVSNWKLSGPPGVGSAYYAASINVIASVPTNSLTPVGTGQAVAAVTYTNITNTASGSLLLNAAGATSATALYTATLPLGLNLSQLVVTPAVNSFNGSSNCTGGSLEMDVYEVFIVVIQ